MKKPFSNDDFGRGPWVAKIQEIKKKWYHAFFFILPTEKALIFEETLSPPVNRNRCRIIYRGINEINKTLK